MEQAVTSRALRNLVADDIGGAVVLKAFRGTGGEMVLAGTRLTEEHVRAMPRANRESLVDNHRLHILSKSQASVASEPRDTHAFVVHLGAGKYNVIEGVKINDEPITKEEAEALAGTDAKPN